MPELLTKRQLEDAVRCREIDCKECQLWDVHEEPLHCTELVAKTAITLYEIVKRLVVAIDTDVNIFKVNDNTQNALNAADNLIKTVEG